MILKVQRLRNGHNSSDTRFPCRRRSVAIACVVNKNRPEHRGCSLYLNSNVPSQRTLCYRDMNCLLIASKYSRVVATRPARSLDSARAGIISDSNRILGSGPAASRSLARNLNAFFEEAISQGYRDNPTKEQKEGRRVGVVSDQLWLSSLATACIIFIQLTLWHGFVSGAKTLIKYLASFRSVN